VLLDRFRTDGGNRDGGCLRFGPGMLYVGVGERYEGAASARERPARWPGARPPPRPRLSTRSP
jgi:hypothetical protein